MLEAIPEDVDFGYKPHPKSMALGRLAGHLTDFAGDWALHTVTKDKLEFAADHKWEAYAPKSKAELLARFDQQLPTVRAELAALPLEKWTSNGSSSLAGTHGSISRGTKSFASQC